MTIKNQLQPIGVVLPIRNGSSGYFEQSYDSLSQTKSNILNLLNTRPGERRMQPTFGSRLWSLLFEQNSENLTTIANNIVKEDISTWISNVTVTDISSKLFKNDQSIQDVDIYKLSIAISFELNMTKQRDSISIIVDNITL